jgi:hypothetical protein
MYVGWQSFGRHLLDVRANRGQFSQQVRLPPGVYRRSHLGVRRIGSLHLGKQASSHSYIVVITSQELKYLIMKNNIASNFVKTIKISVY